MAASNETGRSRADPIALELNDETVREYLKNNSDFLQRNPDMLDYLHISHASGSAVSLVEKQVSVLRERNIDMRHRLNSAHRQRPRQRQAVRADPLTGTETTGGRLRGALYQTFMTSLGKTLMWSTPA